jgi:hypothetical protein
LTVAGPSRFHREGQEISNHIGRDQPIDTI